jgi:hypothetical protein
MSKAIAWATYRDPQSLYMKELTKRGVLVATPLKSLGKIGKVFRRLAYYLHLSLNPFYRQGDWAFKGYDLLIVDQSILLYSFVKKVHRLNPGLKIVIWNENPVEGHFSDHGLRQQGILFSSFDPADCAKYGLLHNDDFFFADLVPPKKVGEPLYDFLFVGQDKGRRQEIEALGHYLEGLGYRVHLVFPGGSTPFIPYESYLQMVGESRVLLDIVQEGQKGLSLRPLEALYAQTKLLTTNPKILAMDFYRPQNALVFGSAYPSKDVLQGFLAEPWAPVDSQILARHDFAAWVEVYFRS